ncbi:MAG: OmpA family protein [Myxococcota bacterium]|nr:OmpA family protein [Myxococcota bacterium]
MNAIRSIILTSVFLVPGLIYGQGSAGKQGAKPTTAAKAASSKAATTAKGPSSKSGSAPSKKKTAQRRGPKTAAISAGVRRSTQPKTPKREALAGRSASTSGPIGLDAIWSADPGVPKTARMRLSLGYFDASDFPTTGSENRFAETEFALAYTAHRLVETFFSLRATGNTNFDEQPALLQTQGDMRFGAKVGAFITDMVAVGGAIGLRMLTGLGQGGFDPDATSFDFRLLTTVDLQRVKKGPTRLLVDLGFVVDNSDAVLDSLAGEPSLIQEFGLQTASYNRLTFGLGIDSPFHQYVSAFAEYRISLPFLVKPWVVGDGADDYSFASVPHSLTIGGRGFPIEELAIDLGLRIGLSSEPFTGVPATPPWTIIFGVAYTIDPRPRIQVVDRPVKVVAQNKGPVPKKTVTLTGQVFDAQSKKPLAEAMVTYPSRLGLSPQVTTPDGRFGGYELPSGQVQLSVSAPGYKPQTVGVKVSAKKPVQLKIQLDEDPNTRSGPVQVRVFNERGQPMKAQVAFAGDASGTSGVATARKPFSATVKGGRHPIIITANGFNTLRQTVQIKGGEPNALRFTMRRSRSVGSTPGVARQTPPGTQRRTGGGRLATVSTKGINLKKPVTFEPNSAQLTAQGTSVLNDVAKGLSSVPQITRVRVGAHVQSQASASDNAKLSHARARAVKSHLVSKGVDGRRVQARGYGSTKPKYPNISARNKRKNERVDFTILKTK